MLQEDHAGCRQGHILEIGKTKGKEPIGDYCNIPARENDRLEEYFRNIDGKKWSESRAILETELTALGNGMNMGEKGKFRDNSTVSGSGY